MNEANSLSVVIPVYNEEENLAELTAQVLAAVRRLSRPFEILFIDDGSTDGSLALIRQLAQAHPEVRYLAFAANAGQSAAFAEGFQEARGAFVVTLDADLQNDPADIPALFAKQAEGFDMVIGWRAKRKDTWIKRYGSKIANAVRSRLTRDGVRDTGCSLKLMRADLAPAAAPVQGYAPLPARAHAPGRGHHRRDQGQPPAAHPGRVQVRHLGPAQGRGLRPLRRALAHRPGHPAPDQGTELAVPHPYR